MKTTEKKAMKTKDKYFTKDGVEVPGVTTITGMLNKPAIVHWAWKLGMSGLDYKKVLNTQGDIGTVAHYLIECDITNTQPDLDMFSKHIIEKAETAFIAWLDFKDPKWDILISEIPFISESLRVGGKPDLVVRCKNGNVRLIDFKTSTGNSIYQEWIMQVSAYKYIIEENTDLKIDEVVIVRLGKEDGSFTPYKMPLQKADVAVECFKHLREVYDLLKKVEV